MGMLYTPGQADALCTVIALGFIISSEGQLKDHSYIIYLDGTDDDAEYRRHRQLEAKLAKLTGMKKLFDPKPQTPGGKSRQPVILAQTNRSVLQGEIMEHEKAIFKILEDKVNDFAKEPLRGAYVGGFTTEGKTQLLDPSILYWYKANHRKLSPAGSEEEQQERIETSYQNALAVTETVQNFLGGVFSGGQVLKHGGERVCWPDERPLAAELERPTGSDLFASVHGMTQSIIHYYGNGDPNKVNIELALSKDTCKVASCIPCSLFMWSNGTPATATHFGRGDNWNFPPKAFAQMRMCPNSKDLTPLSGYPCVVQGTNGERLSTVFNTVINNYVPRLEALKSFVNDQKNLREWLLAPVTDEVRGERKTMSRMAMARELYDEFLERRNEWYSTKNRVYEEYRARDDLDGYANWLSSEGLVQEEQISNFYNDAVVRGHYHEVLTLLGFLNVSSPSEALENTKQKMRSSLRRSLDGSTDVYPVQFQPSDWFKSLRPNLSPKDLTMAAESLAADYRAKQRRLRGLKAQLAEQTAIEIPAEEQERLKTEVENRRQQLSQSQQALLSQYGSGALSAVKAVIGIYKNERNPYAKAQEVIDKARSAKDKQKLDLTESRVCDLLEDIADDVVKSIIQSCQAQDAVLQDINRLNEARMACSEAKVRDMTLQKQRIEEQIQTVQADLDFLTPLVTGTIAAASTEGAADADAALLTASDEAQDENFMDVIIKSDESGSFSSNSTSSSSSQSSWSLGGWFWSGGGSRSTQNAAETQKKMELNKKLEIGFRVKKVSIDRGGWFNPTIFKLSDNYYRLADIRVSKGLTKTDVHKASSAGMNSAAQLNELVTYEAEVNGEHKKLSYVLPSFPTGFVIAKDITIRIQCDKTSAESSRKYMEQSDARGGGIFGFRANSGSSSKSQSESAYFGSTSNFFYIRIPGPQILGWFLELTPADNASPYQKLDPSLYSDALDALLPEQKEDGAPEEGGTA